MCTVQVETLNELPWSSITKRGGRQWGVSWEEEEEEEKKEDDCCCCRRLSCSFSNLREKGGREGGRVEKVVHY